MIHKITQVYSRSIGSAILTTDDRYRQYWLAAMGMYETLSIMRVNTVIGIMKRNE